MKKAATILILLLISAFMLTGCAKCIDKKEESVKVKIVNEYYKPKETRFIGIINHVPQFRTDYAEYEITVDYNGTEYSLSDESTPITRSFPRASTQSAATTEESFPPEIPTIALQPGPF